MVELNNEKKTTRSYTVLEITSPIVITLINGDVINASTYTLGTVMCTCVGQFAGPKGTERTLIVPMSSILMIDLTSKEVPENEVPIEFKDSIKMQKTRLGLETPQG